jgi:hypothetical protein
MTTSRDFTDKQLRRQDLARHTIRLAEHLESGARRIRQHAPLFNNEEKKAAPVAADIISEYTQLGGQAGTILWQLIEGSYD